MREEKQTVENKQLTGSETKSDKKQKLLGNIFIK